ncbi:MAG TPA: hypothetical protein VGK96_02425, partial [Candidatus Sulfotelmatobacter sp.]
QSYSWSGALDLSLQLINVLSSNLTAEANPRSAFTRNPFNFEGHGSLYPKPSLANATNGPFTIP